MVKGFYKGKSLDLFDGDFFWDSFYHGIQQEDKKRLAFGKSSFFVMTAIWKQKSTMVTGNHPNWWCWFWLGKLCDTSTRFPMTNFRFFGQPPGWSSCSFVLMRWASYKAQVILRKTHIAIRSTSQNESIIYTPPKFNSLTASLPLKNDGTGRPFEWLPFGGAWGLFSGVNC